MLCFPDMDANAPAVLMLAENRQRTYVVATRETEHIFLFGIGWKWTINYSLYPAEYLMANDCVAWSKNTSFLTVGEVRLSNSRIND